MQQPDFKIIAEKLGSVSASSMESRFYQIKGDMVKAINSSELDSAMAPSAAKNKRAADSMAAHDDTPTKPKKPRKAPIKRKRPLASLLLPSLMRESRSIQ